MDYFHSYMGLWTFSVVVLMKTLNRQNRRDGIALGERSVIEVRLRWHDASNIH